MRASRIGFDGGEQGCVSHHDFEGVDVVALVDSDNQRVRLPNSSRDVLFCRLYLLDKHLLADWVNRTDP